MSSFLNKKLNLILLILATLIIATTITSASAENSVSISLNDGSVLKEVNVGNKSTLTFNGTVGVGVPITNFSSAKGLNVTPSTPNPISNDRPFNGTVQLVLGGGLGPGGNDIILNETNITDRNWSLSLDTDNPNLRLGNNVIYVIFIGGDSLTQVTGLPPILTLANGNSIQHNGGNLVNLALKGTPVITIDRPAGLRVGQVANFTVTVGLPNPNNTSQMLYNVSGIPVFVTDGDGNLILDVNGNPVVGITTNGTFTFSYLVSKLNFAFTAFANVSADANFSNNYTEANNTIPFTAVKGQANLTELWFDSPWGYVIGQNATILWNFNGIALDTVGNRTITLFYYSNNKLQRTEIVKLYNPTSINSTNGTTRSAMGYWTTTFTQAHDNLTIIAVFPEDPEYLRSEVRNSTFVDVSNDSRRTTITYSFPEDGLKVGVTSDITIYVKDYKGNPVTSGSVTILWDGQYRWDVDVGLDGKATFTHTYTTAGAARNVTFTYNGEANGTRASSVTNTTKVERGTPSIVLTQQPAFAVVGQEVTIAGAINNIALGTAPKYVTLEFKSASGNVLHTINNITMTTNTASSAIAQVTYTYIQAHPSLQLVMTFAGDSNYNAVSGTTNTIVTPAPVI